jgi:hypothetical protein
MVEEVHARSAAAEAHGREGRARPSGGIASRSILKGFQRTLVSMQGVGYHRGAIGFRGTAIPRRVGSFIPRTARAQE